jgi:hypothetical protein
MASRLLRLRTCLIVAVLVELVAIPQVAIAQPSASLVHITRTSRWTKPSPDPMGLTYNRAAKRLMVVDSEVDETPLWARANIWMMRSSGWARRSWSLARFTVEPTDIAYKDRRTLFYSDDNKDRIFRVRRGPDKRWGTRDDSIRSFPTAPFGSGDPEGLEFALGSLFITDGTDARVYRVRPGRDGAFTGAPPIGDDVVTSFSTLSLGIRDPEDVAYDRTTGLLYLISRIDAVIARTTLGGSLVDQIDISSFGLVNPAGITLAPGSQNPAVRNVFIADRGVDNDADQGGDPLENDGRIFEFALTG